MPTDRRADFRAQFAANAVGAVRVNELIKQHGWSQLQRLMAAILDYTERRTRAAIREVPDGTYAFADRFDCPELDDELELQITVVVSDDEIHVDFADNPPQVRASVNMVWSALCATVYYALKTLLDPEVLANAGLYRPIRIEAPRGSIVNCIEPAAVNGRTETCQRVVDLIFGALAPALPDRVTAASNGANTGVQFSGIDSRTGRYFIYLETIGGGSGARATKDGLDGVQVHVTNTSNLPVECLEAEYPLVIEAYELVEDSGGAGQHRGGMGIRRRVRVEERDIQFWLDTTRLRSQPWGLFGGLPGACARVELSDGAREVDHGHTVLQPNDTVAIITGGAGGYGPTTRRTRTEVRADLANGVISDSVAAEAYAEQLVVGDAAHARPGA